MRKSSSLLASLAFLSLVSLSAQQALTPSASLPVPDGVVGAGEYQVTADASGMTIGATLGEDGKLYLSVRAPTSGWVALGLGNGRMDGSRLFLAYDSGGKQDFAEQRGVGHSHKDLADPAVEKWAVKSEGGYTTLELVVPASAGVEGGKAGILYAYSDSNSYSSRHKARGFMSLAVGS
jgi:hypothetical protein